jgi:hypothetical protein
MDQVKALSADDRWQVVDALLATLEPAYGEDELESAREGLRRHRANPEAAVDAAEFMAQLVAGR